MTRADELPGSITCGRVRRGHTGVLRPNRKLDGCAENVGFLSMNPLPIGANAKKASLPTPWDLFDESDAPIGRRFAR